MAASFGCCCCTKCLLHKQSTAGVRQAATVAAPAVELALAVMAAAAVVEAAVVTAAATALTAAAEVTAPGGCPVLLLQRTEQQARALTRAGAMQTETRQAMRWAMTGVMRTEQQAMTLGRAGAVRMRHMA